MKKLLFLLVIITACQRDIVPIKSRSASVALTDVNIGTTANDGTGDALRTAFGKVNSNNTLIENAFATVPTDAEMRDAIADSLQNLKEEAEDGDLIYFERATADAPGEAVTYEGMVNYVAANGGTGSGGYKWTEFIVGTTTGAPEDGDATFTISDFAGDVIRMDVGKRTRDSLFINEGDTNTYYGYRYNSSGKITVRPALREGERVYIQAVPTSAVTKITLSGGESSLLTGLRAGWKMDETAGTSVTDVLSTYTGSTTATVNQTGKFGKAHSYTGSQLATFGTEVGDLGTNDFSYACWIYVPTLQSAYNGILEMQSGVVSFYAMVDEDNKIRAIITFNDSDYINIVSNSAISAATWTHIAVNYDRSGNGTLYINGVAQTDVEDISSGVAVDVQCNLEFRIGRGGTSTWYFNGSIDDVYLWTKVLTQDEIDDLQLGTHPW